MRDSNLPIRAVVAEQGHGEVADGFSLQGDPFIGVNAVARVGGYIDLEGAGIEGEGRDVCAGWPERGAVGWVAGDEDAVLPDLRSIEIVGKTPGTLGGEDFAGLQGVLQGLVQGLVQGLINGSCVSCELKERWG